MDHASKASSLTSLCKIYGSEKWTRVLRMRQIGLQEACEENGHY